MKRSSKRGAGVGAVILAAVVSIIVVGTIPDALAANIVFLDRGRSGSSHAQTFVKNVWYADSATRLSYGVRMGGHSGLYDGVTCSVDYRNVIGIGGCDSVTYVQSTSGTTYSYKVRCMSPSIFAELSTHVHCWSYFAP